MRDETYSDKPVFFAFWTEIQTVENVLRIYNRSSPAEINIWKLQELPLEKSDMAITIMNIA
jgi:hypothetical protein